MSGVPAKLFCTAIKVLLGLISPDKRDEFHSDRMSYTILRGSWCHIIVLNIRTPREDKTDGVKDSFHEGLKCIFDKFPKYHMKFC
jgi:hypothetical protein